MKSSLNKVNPNHKSQKSGLRGWGIALIIVGAIFSLIGLGSFFSSFGSFESPKYFWCCFIGLPMLGIGITLVKYSYLGKITRYIAGETAPPIKDAFNYLAENTQDGMKTIASNLKQGSNDQDEKTVEERLSKLDSLREKGVVTELEYKEQRDRILEDL